MPMNMRIPDQEIKKFEKIVEKDGFYAIILSGALGYLRTLHTSWIRQPVL